MAKPTDNSAAEMRKLCAGVDAAIARGEIPPAAMADLKQVVDEARLRLWASMESAKSGDPTWAQEFWLQRAAEMCRSASQLLEGGGVDRSSPRAADLRAAAERLAASLGSRPR